MPRGDRTGPRGMGDMTGRGAGFCAGNQTQGEANSIFGGMFGGRGRGWCNWFNSTSVDLTPQAKAGAESGMPTEQIVALRKQLDEISKRLDALDRKNS